MLIANPLYDNVFKYLLEDSEIARNLLGEILDVEVLSVDTRPQELTTTLEVGEKSLTVFRMDFVCLIRTRTGEHKKVLIELQKSKNTSDLLRFRRYLGENYQRTETISSEKGQESQPLEIVTIYFLGYKIPEIEVPVLHVGRIWSDAASGETLGGIRSEFVRLLTHESYVIQTPRLPREGRRRLEQVLRVFGQTDSSRNQQLLEVIENQDDPALTQQMIRRLLLAASSEEIRRKVALEDELERGILQEYREQSERLKAAIEEKEAAEALVEQERKEKEAAEALVEQERKEKEAAEALVEQERKEKEETQRLAVRALLAAGQSAEAVAAMLNLPTAVVLAWQND